MVHRPHPLLLLLPPSPLQHQLLQLPLPQHQQLSCRLQLQQNLGQMQAQSP
jgi:hypothetical protein